MKSIRNMLEEGTATRAHSIKVPLDLIYEQPGFNLRQEGEDLDESIRLLAEHIAAGGMYPALEVRAREDDKGVYVVDGHRRRRALILARDTMGAPVDQIHVVVFTGNDADRLTRVMTSAEGRALSPLETAMGYKRLAAFDLTADEIAKRVGKTRQHVDQGLILANAPMKVHKLVAAGKVSAALAVDAARKHGDEAGEVLEEQLEKAVAGGHKKVTAGNSKPKPLPPAITGKLVDAMDSFSDGMGKGAHEAISQLRKKSIPDDTPVEVPAALLLQLIEAHAEVMDARAEQRRRAKEKAAKAKQKELKPEAEE